MKPFLIFMMLYIPCSVLSCTAFCGYQDWMCQNKLQYICDEDFAREKMGDAVMLGIIPFCWPIAFFGTGFAEHGLRVDVRPYHP